jgi:hypothetical protein
LSPATKSTPNYVAAFALYKLEFLFRNQSLDPNLKPARYQILLAARLIANNDPLPRFNSHDMERHSKVICEILWNPTRSLYLFRQASMAVQEVAAGDFTSDNIRTLPFTEKVLSRCATIKLAPAGSMEEAGF